MLGSSPQRGPDSQLSSQRAARLYRLLITLDKSPRTRAQLVKLGRVGLRSFYRDLIYLQRLKIKVKISRGRYQLATPLQRALGHLPFPTPRLTFADAIELAKGSGSAHKRLKAQLNRLTR